MKHMKTTKKTDTQKPPVTEKHASNKEVDELLLSLQDKFGEGAIMKMGDMTHVNVSVVQTGSFSLDLALGVGGLPRGRITEIFGPESSGKTTLALNVVAQAQKQGGKAAFIDAEHAMDPEYAAKLGVNVNELLFPAGQRRGSVEYFGEYRAIGDHLRRRRGFRRGAHPARGARGRNGRTARRPPGAHDGAGAAQAHRDCGEQPDAHHPSTNSA